MKSLAKQLIEENIKTKNTFLNLGHCSLQGNEDILQNLTALSYLKSISLSENEITTISFLAHLPSITSIYIKKNRLAEINTIKSLKQLKILFLGSNQISDIEPIEKLNKLEELHLEFNKITDITPLKMLKNLSELNLEYNYIEEIPINFFENLVSLEEVYLYKNPIQNIPKEIFDKDDNVLTEVKTYLQDLEKGKTKNNEVKVILIGNGSVGKTQISRRLRDKDEFDFEASHQSTHAIDLLQTKIACDFLEEDLQLNLWDFGGQDIYHATHRLFMQTRALFLLVWDTENEVNPYHEWEGVQYKNEKLRYWLEYASFFGQNSPILVVQNKVDTEAQEDLGIPQPEQEKIKAEFPNITEFWQSSAKTGHNFEELEYFIAETFENNESLRQDLIERELPISWIEVRNRVRAEQAKNSGQKQITFETFETWCTEAEVKDSAPTILGFFHDTGVLYYQKQYFGGQIILNQAWAIEAVYQILDRRKGHYKIIQKRNGQLDYKWLCKIWKNNTDAEKELFMDFMLSTEMCFETSKDKSKLANRTFVVPQMLKTDKPSYIKDYQAQYQITEIHKIAYRFLPAVFIQRFMVQVKDFANTKDMWQSGIYLSYQNKLAVVEADYENYEILIHYQAEGKELLEAIKELLKAIQNNESISAKEGEKDIFQQFLEKSSHTKHHHTMESIINKALDALENADTVGYFAEMDKVREKMSSIQKNTYATHKAKFIGGHADWNFAQQLTVFTKQLVDSEDHEIAMSSDEKKTIIQKADKIYNIGHIDKVD